jgi:uncharacterized Fe-S cluster-containing radical SAM superfamily protein
MQKPFNPLELARETEKIFIDGNKRKYYSFRVEPFYGQMATARGPGCDLRCVFCWTDPSKEASVTENVGNFGKSYSPREVYDEIVRVSSNEHGRGILTEGVRVSGFEPTIGRQHLLELIDTFRQDGDNFHWFLLETNGILLGADESYVRDLSKFGDYLQVRLSIKAGTPEAFEKKTGAKAEFFELPWQALHYLRKYGIKHRIAAMSEDPSFTPQEERRGLFQRLAQYHETGNEKIDEELLSEEFNPRSIDPRERALAGILALKRSMLVRKRLEQHYPELFDLEEESLTLYGLTRSRMAAAGLDMADIGKARYVDDRTELLRLSRAQGISLERFIGGTIFKTEPVQGTCRVGCIKRPWHGAAESDMDKMLD